MELKSRLNEERRNGHQWKQKKFVNGGMPLIHMRANLMSLESLL